MGEGVQMSSGSTLLTCPQGHQWTPAANGATAAEEWIAFCPVCGERPESQAGGEPITVILPPEQQVAEEIDESPDELIFASDPTRAVLRTDRRSRSVMAAVR